jgi:hypothetical protein
MNNPDAIMCVLTSKLSCASNAVVFCGLVCPCAWLLMQCVAVDARPVYAFASPQDVYGALRQEICDSVMLMLAVNPPC